MPDIESLLNRWQSAGVLEPEAARRIRAWESAQDAPSLQQSQRVGWQGMVALILGALLLACGVVLFVSAHWDQLGPGSRFGLVVLLLSVFHLAGAATRARFLGLSIAFHAVGTVSAGASIALVGQIFNLQEHWPTAILLWAIAALAGWALLGDEAQQTLTFLLFPAWMLSEIAFAVEDHAGSPAFIGRFLAVWAVLYLTLFLGTRRRAVGGILFAVSAIAGAIAVGAMVLDWDELNFRHPSTLSLGARALIWAATAAMPLGLSIFRPIRSFIPVAVSIAFAALLPFVAGYSNWTHLAAQLLVAAFTLFLLWWGVRRGSHALVNLSMVWFALTVAWFYFSSIFDKVGRSLGLIGIGVLFLAGGWALEKTRRNLIARMDHPGAQPREAW